MPTMNASCRNLGLKLADAAFHSPDQIALNHLLSYSHHQEEYKYFELQQQRSRVWESSVNETKLDSTMRCWIVVVIASILWTLTSSTHFLGLPDVNSYTQLYSTMSEPPSRNITKPYVSLLWYKSQVHRFLRDLQYVSMTLDPLHIFDCVAILITHLDQWCIVQHTTYDCNEVTPIQNTYPSVKNVIRTKDSSRRVQSQSLSLLAS